MVRILSLVALTALTSFACSSSSGEAESPTDMGSTASSDTRVADVTMSSDTSDGDATATASDTSMAADTGSGADSATDATRPDTSPADATVADTASDADTRMEPMPPPTNGAALATWLAERRYADWSAESSPHASAGPHFGTVRTFVDDSLFASLEAGASSHPVGAAAVKELYGDGDMVLGYAVMVKVDAAASGDSWYWYEEYQGSVFADGIGDGLCTGCHAAGTDSVLTPFPLQ